jgi:hypothetical protein
MVLLTQPCTSPSTATDGVLFACAAGVLLLYSHVFAGYKNVCQDALSKCKDTNSTSLVVATCPDPRFSECWQSSDQIFQCFGRRRPSFGNEDIAAYCNSPEGSGAGAPRLQLVSAI